MNPRPLGPEDWTKNTRGAFRRIWCCLLRERMLARPLRSNASVRSRRGMGQRLGQSVITIHKTVRRSALISFASVNTTALMEWLTVDKAEIFAFPRGLL